MSPTKVLIPILLIFLTIAGFYFFKKEKGSPQESTIQTKVNKGDFLVHVTATGELKAKKSEKIQGAAGMRSVGIYQTTITDLIPEGTIVKAGDYIATLDKTELETKMKDAVSEVEKIETQLAQAKIDTAIEMRGIRDELTNLKFAKKEKLLYVEQSKYEAKSVIQQAEIDLQRSARDYDQLKSKLALTKEKSDAKILEINTSLKQNQTKLGTIQKLANDFTIKAPKDGMLIYAQSWNGKIGPGSQVSSWNPTVAELPDLSDMISKIYVNEVDISKVQKGQDVKIKVDAFPDNNYTGQIIKIANIGEQLKNYDSKVFEVLVQVNEVDSILWPAMTTSNEVLVNTYKDVLSIPLEGLFTDSISYVFQNKNGKIIKQEVVAGPTNNNEVIISFGLDEKSEINLIEPENASEIAITKLDPAIKSEIRQKLESEKRRLQTLMEEKKKTVKDDYLPNESSGGSVIIFN